MKKLLFILLLIPFFTFSQSEKRYKSIIIDSVKALSDGSIDFKDTSRFEKMVSIGGGLDTSAQLTITSTDGGILIPRLTTAQRNAISSPATGLLIYNTVNKRLELFETSWKGVGNGFETDSSFVVIMFDTAEAFNNMNIQFKDTVFFQRHVEVDSSFQVNDGQTLLKGIDASSIDFALKVQDDVGTELFNVRNDGNIGIGTIASSTKLDIISSGTGTGTAFRFRDFSGDEIMRFTDNGSFEFNVGGVDTKFRIKNGNVILDQNKYILFDTGAFTTGIRFVSSLERLSIFNTRVDSDIILTANRFITLNAADGVIVGSLSDVTTAQFHIKGTGATSGFFSLKVDDGNEDPLLHVRNDGHIGIGTTNPDEKLHVNGNAIIDSTFSTTARSLTLGAAATTFVITSNVMTITGDGGANTIATITGANSGQYLILIFVDGLVTLTDDNSHASNTLDLSAAFTSSDDTVLHLIYDGTSFYEISRSVN